MESKETSSQSIVGSLMRDAYTRAKVGDTSPIGLPLDARGGFLSEEEYTDIFRNECSYLGKDILSRDMLQKRLSQLFSNIAKLKNLVPDGTKFAIGVLPTTDIGGELDQEAIKNGKYVHDMIINSDGTTASDISMVFGRYFDVLPSALQDQCSLQIHYSNKPEETYQKIYNCYIDAFNAWREFFELDAITDIPRYDIAA